MIGNEYFQTRDRLREVSAGVISLAKKTGTSCEPVEDKAFSKALHSPVVVTVCGEGNTGRSTFLRALFGFEDTIEPADSEDKFLWYQHSRRESDEELSPYLHQVYHSHDALEFFNLVDAPATNLKDSAINEVRKSILPLSDIICWVFSVANPWAASTWEAISSLKPAELDKSVVIIQQAELRNEGDLKVIEGHMQDLSEKRVGRQLPIFALSATSALSAKSGEKMDRGKLVRSGFAGFENFISTKVENAAPRMDGLRLVRDRIESVLLEVEKMIDLRKKRLRDNEGFLRDIESEVSHHKERHAADYRSNQLVMQKGFENEIPAILSAAEKKISLWKVLKSFFITASFSKDIEADVMKLTGASVRKLSDESAQLLVKDCEGHWETLRPKVKEQLTVELDAFKDISEVFDETCTKFVDRIENAASDAIVQLRVRSVLDSVLGSMLHNMKLWLYGVLGCLSCAGVIGAAFGGYLNVVAFLFLGLAIVATAGFVWRARSFKFEILQILYEKLQDSRVPFADDLDSSYKEGVYEFYITYSGLLGGVRRYIVNAQSELRPNMEQWNTLFLQLKGIEQDL